MKLEVKEALIYPYQGNNVMDTLVIPGVAMVVVFIVTFILIMAGLAVTGLLGLVLSGAAVFEAALTASAIGFMIVLGLLLIGATLVMMVVMLGYRWELLVQIHAHGYAIKAPEWQTSWQAILKSGVAVSIFYLLVGLGIGMMVSAVVMAMILMVQQMENAFPAIILLCMPMVLLVIIGGVLVMPYLWAPMVYAAKENRLNALYEWEPAFEMATRNYKRLLLVWLLNFVISIVYTVGMGIMNMMYIGFLVSPFFTFALGITETHLIAQGFNLAPESAVTQTDEPQ